MLGARATAVSFIAALVLAGAAFAEDKAPAPAARPQSWVSYALALKPGQKIALLVDAQHHVRTGPIGTTNAELAPDAGRADVETYGERDMGVVQPSPPDSLEFALFVDAQAGSRLRLVNHIAEPVIYAAIIQFQRDGHTYSQHTTICSVAAGKGSYETWPQALTQVVIVGIYSAPADPVCGYADIGRLEAPPPTPPPPTTYSN